MHADHITPPGQASVEEITQRHQTQMPLFCGGNPLVAPRAPTSPVGRTIKPQSDKRPRYTEGFWPQKRQASGPPRLARCLRRWRTIAHYDCSSAVEYYWMSTGYVLGSGNKDMYMMRAEKTSRQWLGQQLPLSARSSWQDGGQAIVPFVRFQFIAFPCHAAELSCRKKPNQQAVSSAGPQQTTTNQISQSRTK